MGRSFRLNNQTQAKVMITDHGVALAVPSAILDLLYNLLLHPAHPDFEKVSVVGQRELLLDTRFVR